MDTQLTNITKQEWLKLVKDKYPTCLMQKLYTSTYAFPINDIHRWSTDCLGGHSSEGNYGWVK